MDFFHLIFPTSLSGMVTENAAYWVTQNEKKRVVGLIGFPFAIKLFHFNYKETDV